MLGIIRNNLVVTRPRDGAHVIRHIVATSGVQLEYPSGAVDVRLDVVKIDDVKDYPFQLCVVTDSLQTLVNLEILQNGAAIFAKLYTFEPLTKSLITFGLDGEETPEVVDTQTEGVLVTPKPLPVATPPTQQQIDDHNRAIYISNIKYLLRASDTVYIRCGELKVEFPQTWVDYRDNLRTLITSGVPGVDAIPTTPAYPAGT